MDIIMTGIFICMAIIIICSIVLKIITDKTIRDYKATINELQRRLHEWSECSYKQNDQIEYLERKLKEKS